MQKTYKKWYQSKTIILAILQGAAGVITVIATEHNNTGFLLIVKAVVDVYIRYLTESKIAPANGQ